MTKLDDLKARYFAAAHAVQTGVAYHQEIDPANGSPKHLRVGVNVALRDHASLVKLLMEKGILTELEYIEALVAGMEEEKRQYEEMLQAHYGGKTKITLG